MSSKLKITWVKSAIGFPRDQKDTIRALGLRRLNASVIKEDNPRHSRMIYKVRHLVKVEEA